MEKTKLNVDAYTEIMKRCLESWNKADAELVASFYADDLDYRDPTVPQGISGKEEFIKYLKLIFKVWPEQKWTPKNVLPHRADGSFSVDYEFRIANARTSLQGTGMDRIEFRDDKIRLNHVYLNAEKWKEWIGNELKVR